MRIGTSVLAVMWMAMAFVAAIRAVASAGYQAVISPSQAASGMA